MGIELMEDNEFLTKEEIKKFKEIAQKDYGVKLTDKQALEQGSALVSFFELLLKKRIKKP